MSEHTRWIDENGDPIDEDHRGLVYDVQTLIDRRRALGIFGGVALTTLLAACGAQTDGCRRLAVRDGDGDRHPDAHSVRDRYGRGIRTRRRGARRDRRPVPGRRIERRQRPRRLRDRAQRHPLELRLVDDGRAGRAAHDRADGAGCRDRRRPRRQAASTSGTATARASTRCTAAAPRTRTTCAACRRPTRAAPCASPRSIPRATRVAGRTSTSRSTRISRPPSRPVRSSRRSQIALPAEANDLVYATSGYEQSVRNASQVSLQSDNVFRDDGGIHQIATMSGSVAAGYTASLTIGV